MPPFLVRAKNDWPPGTPGNRCRLCGTGARPSGPDRIVDPCVSVDYEGPLAFCEACVIDMGRAVGLVTSDEADRLRERIAALDELVRLERERAQRAEDALEAAGRLIAFQTHPTSGVSTTGDTGDTGGVPEPRFPVKARIYCGHDGCRRWFTSRERLAEHYAAIHEAGGDT